jgi:arginyl-tRNA synthetase
MIDLWSSWLKAAQECLTCITFAANLLKMELVSQIRTATSRALSELYQYDQAAASILVNETKPEFEGDYTVVLFAFLKPLRKSAEALGNELGEALLKENPSFFSAFNVIKGFLNLTIADGYWMNFLHSEYDNQAFGRQPRLGKTVMIEYSSPNTNKPLHLGHLRNNFLGWSIAEIYKAAGYDIVKTCIANDRGIHICKSMIAWQLFANGATPESTGLKGDHLVGDYYVLFGTELKKQVAELTAEGMDKETAEKEAPIMKAAQQCLVDWEAGKPETIALWKKMNSWVYAGFDETYRRIGSDFDKIYYESNTYLLGKELVEEGLQKGVFEKEADGSVWIDLTADGLDRKIVQRRDGTAVYMTQDIGLAVKKNDEYHAELSIYVVGDEQNYHFKVLKLICQKLGLPSADGIYHLSYGMVELPTGRMKTREGTVVDADDILDEMIKEAERKTKEQGKTDGFTYDELEDLYDIIGLGGLKFFLLRVDPKKRMVFNPEESIDLHGYTATFIQYAYARIRSILRKEDAALKSLMRDSPEGMPVHPAEQHIAPVHTVGQAAEPAHPALLPLEKTLTITLEKFPATLGQACQEMSPSLVASYAFELAKTFNSFYAEHKVSGAETPEKKILRLQLCQMTATVLRTALNILGIRVPERM